MGKGIVMSIVISNLSAFRKDIITATGSLFFGKLQKSTKISLKKIRQLAASWVLDSPEMKSLVSRGDLWHELGIPGNQVDESVSDILDLVISSLNIEAREDKIKSSFVISTFFGNVNNFANLPSGTYTTKKGTEMPWLKSLLLDGSKIIISDYRYSPQESENSRTGFGVMKRGGFWRIPPEYSGTLNDNFITRAVKEKEIIMSEIILSDLRDK